MHIGAMNADGTIESFNDLNAFAASSPMTSSLLSQLGQQLGQMGLGHLASSRRTTPSVPMEQLHDVTRVVPYRSLVTDSATTERCGICQDTFQEDSPVRQIRRCGHYYHLSCIEQWLANHQTCPLCMQNVMEVGEREDPNQTTMGSNQEQEEEEVTVELEFEDDDDLI
jgi:hypothetical protein